MRDRLLFIDTETGGLDPSKYSLLSLGMVVWENMKIIDTAELFINDGKLAFTTESLSINNIDIKKHVKIALSSKEAIGKINTFLKKNFQENKKITLAGHNINFDVNFLRFFLTQNDENFNKHFSHRFIDTSSILYYLYLAGYIKERTISSSAAFDYFKINVEGRHTALGDAIATAQLFSLLLALVKKKFKISDNIFDNQLGLFDSELNE